MAACKRQKHEKSQANVFTVDSYSHEVPLIIFAQEKCETRLDAMQQLRNSAIADPKLSPNVQLPSFII